MKVLIKLICLIVLYAFSSVVSAYELETHSRMTQNAFNRVLTEDNQLINRLGLTLTQGYLDSKYYDVSGANIYERFADYFSNNRMPSFSADKNENIKQSLSLTGWLLRGAIREDDLSELMFWKDDPKDDPYGNFFRVAHHFFDPVNNLPLNGVTMFDTGGAVHTSPAWALGVTNTDAFTSPNTSESGRRNHYSIKDAREYLYRAVTGQDKDGSKAIVPDGSGGAREPNDAAEAEEVRKAYWATTFRALGDVVHLVQDAGQPQHTRNDLHRPFDSPAQQAYEIFVNDRALKNKMTCFTGGDPQPQIELNYVGYPATPGFGEYNSYFSSGPGDISGGKGLADYSNRGFFTAGTNVGSPGNIYTSPDIASLTQETINFTGPCYPPGSQTVVLKGTVTDTLVGFDNYAALTIPGLWNGSWNPYIASTGYSLSEVNYNAMADLLIPRAVAYSAGIINHFFRGKFEVLPPEEGIYGLIDHATPHTVSNGEPIRSDNGEVFGFTKLRLKLRNTTADINDGGATPQDMVGGTLVAVARFRTNPCYQLDLTGEFDDSGTTPNGCGTAEMLNSPEQVAVSAPQNDFSLSSNEQVDLEFDFNANAIPVNATNLFLDIVYRGPLGSETDAVVITSVDLYEPTYISDANNTDYVDVYGDLYTKAEIEADTAIQLLIDQSPEGDQDGGTTDLPDPPTFLEPIDPEDRENISFYFNGGSTPDATLSLLVPKRYNRIVVLTDQDTIYVDVDVSGKRRIGALSPVTSQLADDRSVYWISSFWPTRGYHAWRLHSYHITYGTSSVWNGSTMDAVTGAELTPVTSTISAIWK